MKRKRFLITVVLLFIFLNGFYGFKVWAAADYRDGSNYSMGYKKIVVNPPYVWYFGWDSCNCKPEDLKCNYDPYGQSKVCSPGATGSFPYGPFGGYRFTWGFEDPQLLLNFLEKARNTNIGIGNYTKPLWLSGPTLTGSDGAVYVSQNQATKLYCGVDNGVPQYKWVANYSSLSGTYINWIKDVAAKVKNHPNFAGMTITHGLDGESKCAADSCVTTYPDGTKVADPCVGYQKYKQDITAAYYEYFCNGTYDKNTGSCNGTMKPLFLQSGSFEDVGGQLGQYVPPMGMKFSGFVADTSAVQYGERWRGYGLLEKFARYRNLIPTAIEPKFGNWFLDNRAEAGGQGTYWWNLEALWLRPTYIDINPGYGIRWQTWENPEYFDLINNHLNVSAQTTPDVWIALRDTPVVCGAKTFAEIENNPCANASKIPNGTSGKIGDYDFFLRRPDGINGNKTIALARPDVYENDLTIEPLKFYKQEIPETVWKDKYSRHIRRTDKTTGNYYMSFDVDNDYRYANLTSQTFDATIYYLDLGSEKFYLEYKNSSGNLISKEVQRSDSKTWKKVVITLDNAYFNDNLEGATDFRIYNGGANSSDVYLHMINIKGKGSPSNITKKKTNIICSLPNESIIQGESPTITANLIDENNVLLKDKSVRITIDPYWYNTNRVSYGRTDSSGVSKKELVLTGLSDLFQHDRAAHEVEVVFPGDSDYYSSSSICYFPLNRKASYIQKRTISATLSKNVVNIGDVVTATINAPGGGSLSMEGEGFGMPACYGSINATGIGTCTFKIGGMALTGRRNIGVIVAWDDSSYKAATSINLPITVLGEGESLTKIILSLKSGWNRLSWQTNYPSYKSFSSVPGECSITKLKESGFWKGENLTFKSLQNYNIKCKNSINWEL